MQGGMVPHQRRKDAELQETGQQVFRYVASETAQITAGIQETA